MLVVFLLQPISTPGFLYVVAVNANNVNNTTQTAIKKDTKEQTKENEKAVEENKNKVVKAIDDDKDKKEDIVAKDEIKKDDDKVKKDEIKSDENSDVETKGNKDEDLGDAENSNKNITKNTTTKSDNKVQEEVESTKERKADDSIEVIVNKVEKKEIVSNENDAINEVKCKDKWIEKDGVYTRCVEEDKEYKLDFNKEDKLGALKIKFTKIDKEKNAKNKKEISIKEVKLTDEQVDKLEALGNIAYDITSTMKNGSFEYDLTLPLPKDTDVDKDKSTVIYAKDEKSFEGAKDIKKDEGVKVDVNNKKHKIVVKGVNHFTIFIVKGIDASVVQKCEKPSVKNEVTKKEFCTIQEAIDDEKTKDGDKITIGEGEYIEEVSVTKAVSLNCEKGAILNGDKISTDNNPKTAFIIDSNEVTIKGCEIKGYRRGVRNGKMESYTDITIENNYIHNLKPHSDKIFAMGDYSTIAIDFGKNTGTMMVDTDAGDRGFNKIKTEKDLGKRLNYKGLKITGNEISGKNDIYGGIVLSAITGTKKEHIKIEENIITSMKASAIVLDSVAGVDVVGNTLENGMLSGIFISSSEGNEGKYGGGYDMWEVGNDYELGPKDIWIEGNTIVNNGHADKKDCGDWARLGNNGISVLSNPDEIEIHKNKISLNSPFSSSSVDRGFGNGVANLLPNIEDGQVNALNNYWGDSKSRGPRDIWSGDGSVLDTNPDSKEGDYAFGNVLYFEQQPLKGNLVLNKWVCDDTFDILGDNNQMNFLTPNANGEISHEAQAYVEEHCERQPNSVYGEICTGVVGKKCSPWDLKDGATIINTFALDENSPGVLTGTLEVGRHLMSEVDNNNARLDNADIYGFLCSDDVAPSDLNNKWWDTNNVEFVDIKPDKTSYCNVFNKGLKSICGDGVKNGTEQCDGTDGVEEGEFCTNQCKLVPFYGQVQTECADNETPVLVDEKILDSSNRENQIEFNLVTGKRYLVQIAGTYIFNNRYFVAGTDKYKYQADAAYHTGNGWVTSSKTAVAGVSRGGVHSVIGDLGRGIGVIDWGNNPNVNSEDGSNHIYTRLITPSFTGNATFLISDWYGDWYGSSCDNQKQACFNDNTGELKVSLYECRANQEVKVCKEDEDGRSLSGWQLQLLGNKIETLNVATQKNGEAPDMVSSSSLPQDDYVVVASGTYEYRGNTGLLADANFSQRQESDKAIHFKTGTNFPYWNWANDKDFKSGWEGYLGIMVNGTPTNWSDVLASDHRYALGYENYTGTLTFQVKDNAYSDNNGNLNVDIYKGYSGFTEEDGCVIFENVPVGNYSIQETLQDGWENISGLNDVFVTTQGQNTFKVINRKIDASQDCVAGEETFVSEVISDNQGTTGNGGVVASERSDVNAVLGAPDGEALGTFYSLGKDGTITTKFEYPVKNVAGNDLSFYEITWGNRQAYMLEKATVEVSQDGLVWQAIGEVNNHDNNGVGELDFDMTGWSWIQYVRLTDTTNLVGTNGDGYDLDAIRAKSALCEDQNLEAICGDGVKNGTEQCDGTDGVEEGEFCTSTCQAIPQYTTQQRACPSGTTKTLLSTEKLDSTIANTVHIPLTQGTNYLFETTGVYNYAKASSRKADAAYGTIDGFSTTRSDIGIWGTNKGVTSVLGNLGSGIGVVEWDDDTTTNSDHVYTFGFTPTKDMTADFVISDWYSNWYGNNCDGQNCLVDNEGSILLNVYECRANQEVKVCKEDEGGNRLAGWEMTLGTAIVDATPINVNSPSGNPSLARTNTVDLPAGDYVIKVMGTYRYGNNKMIADAGYSYRPANIIYGTDGWVSGFDLGSGSKGLMAWVNDTPVHWGPYNENHEYTYSYSHSGGPIIISIYDNYYSDNVNNGDFRFEIYKRDFQGETSGEDGCVTFENVPQGDYDLSETMQDGWENVSGTGRVTVEDGENTFTVVNEMLPVTINATKIICTDEKDLPNMAFRNEWITADTAQEWVNTHKSCKIVPKWEFEWQYKRSGWKKFDNNNSTQVMVDDVTKPIKVREALPEGYLPFSNEDNNDVTAEFYCANDGLHYDNQDWIDGRSNLKQGGEYYCVAWNVPANGSVSGMKWEDKNMDGKINRNENGLDDWTIVTGQYEEIGQYEIDPKISSGIDMGIFEDGQYYVLKVNGTYDAGDKITADAECSSRDGSPWSTIVKNYESYGEQLLDLEINKLKTEWGICNPDHTYTKLIKGNGSHFSVRINEIYRPNDSGKLNVVVYKLDNAKTTLTADGGEYEFTNLMPGKYMVCEMHQENWLQTFPQSSENGGCHIFTISGSNTVVKNQNFGNVLSGTGVIKGQKYRDVNGNGDFDSLEKKKENRLNGWKITLFDANWKKISSMVTRGKGQYRFKNLLVGQYYVCEENRDGWLQTEPNAESGVEHDGQYCHKVIINNPGEKIKEVQFGNFEGGIIQGRKYMDYNVDGLHQIEEERLDGWHIRLYKDSDRYRKSRAQEEVFSRWIRVEQEAITGDNEGSNYQKVKKGQYRFGPLMPGKYYVCEVNQPGYIQTGPILGANTVDLEGRLVGGGVAVVNQSGQDDEGQICWQAIIKKSGQKKTSYKFGNINYGKIIVTKWEDSDADGKFDDNEGVLAGWKMRLKMYSDNDEDEEDKQLSTTQNNYQEIITNDDGQAIFDNLKSGTYKLSELMTESQQSDGWKMTNIYCGEDSLDLTENSEDLEVEVEPGKTIECFVGNQLIESKLFISKTNNVKSNEVKKSGDLVTYTIRVRADQNKVQNVKITDLPPKNLTYVPESWKATSNKRGDLSKIAGLGLTHVYASPGEWSLGNMVKDEVITLTYQAKIDDNAPNGSYKDLVWGNGTDMRGDKLLALAEKSDFNINGGVVNDEFAGTQVVIANDDNPESVTVKADKKEIVKKKKVVTKASSTILPKTGANGIWLLMAGGMFVLGLIVLGFSQMRKRKNIFGLIILVSLMVSINQVSAKTVVRIDEPEANINKPFEIGFVAMDTDENDVIVECWKKGPKDLNFVKFQEVNLIAGGSSGECTIDAGILIDEGEYLFKISIDGVESNVVKTSFEKTRPGEPKYIKKKKEHSCSNELEVKTADDGQTVYVEIYRAKSKTVIANNDSKIKTITIGPNQKIRFNDDLSGVGCKGDYYYAVRAFDDHGNYSSVKEEKYEVKITKKVKVVETNSVESAPTFGNNSSREGVAVSGEEAIKTTEEQQQSEQVKKNSKTDKEEKTQINEKGPRVLGESTTSGFVKILKNWKFWLVIIILTLFGLVVYQKKKANVSSVE